jgi:radical SAM protein with 4Fe4S-binding SPASM domain
VIDATLHTAAPLEAWAGSPVGSHVDARPHVIAWNLTRRCNLACAHCYISAGAWHDSAGELTTAEVRRITDEILALNPAPLFILSGGEPLLRADLEEIAGYASRRGATVVIGTNGTRLTADRIAALQDHGVSGVAISIDSLDEQYHDRFRHGDGALADTLAAVDRLTSRRLDFIVQTTVTRGNRAHLATLAEWAAAHGAVAFNVYFLVETGRGAGMRGLTPAENEEVLAELTALERHYRGRMLVRAKCQPQLMRHVLASDDADAPLRNYATRCPCGVQYCRITPDGKLTPCPYLPVEAGDLRTQSFANVWTDSPVLRALREREPGGKCGQCEYRLVCGGCRARAFARTGDYLGPDDSCVYEPTGDVAVIAPVTSVSYGAPAAATLAWDEDARTRMQRVPSFVRGVVISRIENYARERGHTRVSAALIDEVRRSMPIDFSKRRPFFLGGDA